MSETPLPRRSSRSSGSDVEKVTRIASMEQPDLELEIPEPLWWAMASCEFWCASACAAQRFIADISDRAPALLPGLV